MNSLSDALSAISDTGLSSVLAALASSGIGIADLCRSGSHTTEKTTTTNAFGDHQLEIDVMGDDLLMKNLAATGVVSVASSEETPTEEVMSENGRFVVAFDPLDGSSIIGTNFAVGTIVGIWVGKRIVGLSGDDMVASVAIQYGPRTTMFIAAREWGQCTKEFTLVASEWILTRNVTSIAEGKLFAPANLRSAQDNAGYNKLMQYYLSERYQLRYSGGMVPDVTQIIVKQMGVFASPVSPNAPAKLRLAYEAVPMAFLIESAGGRSSDGEGSLMNRRIKDCEETTAVCVGSAGEVDRFEQFVGGRK